MQIHGVILMSLRVGTGMMTENITKRALATTTMIEVTEMVTEVVTEGVVITFSAV